MRILLSNDDGVNAPGLAALWAAVRDLGEVTVVAPATPQSAAGHAITVRQPLAVQRVTAGAAGRTFPAIAVEGMPADCVRLAIRSLLKAPPDLVISGMNQGANVGINVFYSGTVAAAAEAAMLGFPAVAFSASQDEGPVDFPAAARLCRWTLDNLMKLGLTRGDLMNVNVPSLVAEAGQDGKGGKSAGKLPTGLALDAPRAAAGAAPRRKVRGVRFVPQSTAGLVDTYVPAAGEEGKEIWQLGPEYSHRPQADTDVSALAEGFVTITPLHIDMTNHDRLATLTGTKWQPPQ